MCFEASRACTRLGMLKLNSSSCIQLTQLCHLKVNCVFDYPNHAQMWCPCGLVGASSCSSANRQLENWEDYRKKKNPSDHA